MDGPARDDDVALDRGWELAATPPGAAADPQALAALGVAWAPAQVPGTAASALRAAGTWSLEGPARRFDAEDWWYRCRFAASPEAGGALRFEGLAVIADAWLDGEHLLRSESMFVAREVDVAGRLRPENELVLRFASLDAWLATRKTRPRPRWRAPMIENQALRWARATVLGRTPGWSPPAAAVGPWRHVRLVRRPFAVEERRIAARLDGGRGALEVSLALRPRGGARIEGGRLRLSRGEMSVEAPLAASSDGGVVQLHGRLEGLPVEAWWPHTHGAQPLYDVAALAAIDGEERVVDRARVGFRAISLRTEGGDFALSCNGVPIFCRGACWTPLDVASLSAPREAYREALAAVRAAGMNMLRVGGTMVYEDEAFLDACDEMGILVWQELMFANMDFPEQDEAFAEAARLEAAQELRRWQGRPSLAVVCGDSEGEQQAAMWGAPREAWARPLFREALRRVAEERRSDVPYWPSSASGGAFPHQPSAGTCSYYGVGAYLRPLDDARRSGLRFASECLGFANIPSDRALAAWGGGAPPRVHSPQWKARTPRDLGACWDFDDVRDHYVGRLFGVDPLALRWEDHDRYLELGRVASGEVMAAAMAEWRRAGSSCRGALVWFLRDIWPGAGWGIVDAHGRPKAAYHLLKRALAPVAVLVTDEGLNGVSLHVVNEPAAPLRAEVRLDLYRDGETRVGGGALAVEVAARGALEMSGAALLEGFADIACAYRFGPPAHDLAVATLVGGDGAVIGQAFHAPRGLSAAREADLGLTAEVAPAGEGAYDLTLRARRFAHAVAIEAPGYEPEDDFVHVAPGGACVVRLRGAPGGAPPRGTAKALNARAASRFGGAG